MSDFKGRPVQPVTEVFTKEALRQNDGKVVPLTDRPGGTQIGVATLRFDEEESVLMADFDIDDPEIKKALESSSLDFDI